MGGQKGTSANRERLKDLSDMIRICTGQVRRCLHVRENRQEMLDIHNDEILEINAKIDRLLLEYKDAPAELIKLRRQLDKFRAEQDQITGHVTGRTKLVDKVRKAREKLAKLEAELVSSGLDVDDICVEPDDGTERETNDGKQTTNTHIS